jgi:hypothetical protein
MHRNPRLPASIVSFLLFGLNNGCDDQPTTLEATVVDEIGTSLEISLKTNCPGAVVSLPSGQSTSFDAEGNAKFSLGAALTMLRLDADGRTVVPLVFDLTCPEKDEETKFDLGSAPFFPVARAREVARVNDPSPPSGGESIEVENDGPGLLISEGHRLTYVVHDDGDVTSRLIEGASGSTTILDGRKLNGNYPATQWGIVKDNMNTVYLTPDLEEVNGTPTFGRTIFGGVPSSLVYGDGTFGITTASGDGTITANDQAGEVLAEGPLENDLGWMFIARRGTEIAAVRMVVNQDATVTVTEQTLILPPSVVLGTAGYSGQIFGDLNLSSEGGDRLVFTIISDDKTWILSAAKSVNQLPSGPVSVLAEPLGNVELIVEEKDDPKTRALVISDKSVGLMEQGKDIVVLEIPGVRGFTTAHFQPLILNEEPRFMVERETDGGFVWGVHDLTGALRYSLPSSIKGLPQANLSLDYSVGLSPEENGYVILTFFRIVEPFQKL